MSDERRRAITSTPRLTADEIASRTFSSTFRGISESEVTAYLRRVADEIADSQRRVADLEAALAAAEVAAAAPRSLTEEELLDALGDETARLLHTARDAARDIRTKAEENAGRILAEARETAERLRTEADGVLAHRTEEAESAAAAIVTSAEERSATLRAETDRIVSELRAAAEAEATALRDDAGITAEAEIERARQHGRHLVDTARDLRERVLADLNHRRRLLGEQISELRSGRERLLEAYRVVKRSFLDATEALAEVEGKAAERRPETVDASVIDAALAGEATTADDAAAELADSVPIETSGEAADGSATVSGEGDAASDARGAPDAGDLFARLRAEREAAVRDRDTAGDKTSHAPSDDADAPVSATGETVPAAGVVLDAVDVPDNDTPSARAAGVIERLSGGAIKIAKRVAQDEQNATLDTLRRHKGRPDAVALGPIHQQAERWLDAVWASVEEAYRAGAESVGADVEPEALDRSVAIELVQSVLEPVRATFAQAISGATEAGEAIERINARAREFRNQDLADAVRVMLAGAYARGVYDRAPDGATLEWVLARAGCGADCADNALEPTAKGLPFPTGHQHPPAFAGCRCTLAVAVVTVS
jgi:DivIVA domain-containing protein